MEALCSTPVDRWLESIPKGPDLGALSRDSDGQVIDVMAGVGIYFASQVGELISVLESRDESFSRSNTECVVEATSVALEHGEPTQQHMEDTFSDFTDALVILVNRFWIVTLILAIGILVALAVSLRRPRERILLGLSEYRAHLPQINSVRESVRIKRGIALSGFTSDGKPLRIKFSGRHFAHQGLGACDWPPPSPGRFGVA